MLAYRVAAHQFDRSSKDPDVLALGVQDTPYGSARLALAARGASAEGLPLVWTVRGAPHLHRAADLPGLAEALWPLSDADATTRILTTSIKEGAKLGIAAFRATAEAFRKVVTGPMPKGEVSTGVSALVPASLTYFCKPCDAQHISGQLFQYAGPAGGIEVRPRGNSTILAPLPDRFGIPSKAVGTAGYVSSYLRLLGPGTPGEAAKFLGTTQTAAKSAWPKELTEVTVEGKRAWLPSDSVDALLDAGKPSLLRLLPPGDPYLQTRDRSFLVPDKNREKEIWRAIGNPGVVLLDGEVAGTWRPKASGKRLDLLVTAFTSLPEKKLQAEAQVVAEVRGAKDLRLQFVLSGI